MRWVNLFPGLVSTFLFGGSRMKKMFVWWARVQDVEISNIWALMLDFRGDLFEKGEEKVVLWVYSFDCPMIFQLALMSPISWPGFHKIRRVGLRAFMHARSQIAWSGGLDFYSPWLGMRFIPDSSCFCSMSTTKLPNRFICMFLSVSCFSKVHFLGFSVQLFFFSL